MIGLWALAGTTLAADREHTLSWRLSVDGTAVGTRTLTVRQLGARDGTSRMLTEVTEITLGEASYRRRLSAHVAGRQPAAFHAVVDNDGATLDVQGRWTPLHWIVTTTSTGRSRTRQLPLGQIDLSTVDLADPLTSLPLTRLTSAQVLDASTGEVQSGSVEHQGTHPVQIAGQTVQSSQLVWSGPQGAWTLFYSSDGHLVRYERPLLGSVLVGELSTPAPSGVDDFPVDAQFSVDALEIE
ncbi:MAG: hypothetical protein KTR31_06410 [Myxococcales bacterium]|nr:hypothetical protein [Myxococcales bacterium]